ncbi:MAG: NAD(P)H-dependent oxidoreductase [Planctomycetes bacterium]|nr:NAD(P)H-dependent oxidoreductase [Planctomycetota bacterium]
MSSTKTASPSAKLTPEQLLTQLRWRYATKRFDPEIKIDAATWSALEQALLLAPSSYGLQPWRFLVVKDPAVRAKLRPASWNQAQITEASHLVVFAIKKGLNAADVRRYVERIAAVRQVARESLAGYEQMMVSHVQRPAPFDIDEWSRRQLYIALGTFLTSAALLGVDACPMEGIDPAQYDALLGLGAQSYATVVVATAGKRASDDAYANLAKVRFDARDVITHVG